MLHYKKDDTWQFYAALKLSYSLNFLMQIPNILKFRDKFHFLKTVV